MNVSAINNVNGSNYILTSSTILKDAADELLDTLKGVQYIQAKTILELAIEKLNSRTKVVSR